jgi:succinate dehydrogenase hydrophobic anchor subunit
MNQPQLREKELNAALHQFIFPFSINNNAESEFKRQLKLDDFIPFFLGDLEQEDMFYGVNYQVSHHEMERYYLPFTNNVLFPHKTDNESSFQRYSKRYELSCELKTEHTAFPFTIHSVDVTLCPFDLGFITIRTELECEVINYSLALEFAKRFRVLQNISKQDDKTYIQHQNVNYNEVEEFIFAVLVPDTLRFLDKETMDEAYFENLPFFIDERMFVESFFSFQKGSEITLEDQYRAARTDGLDDKGEPFIGATNMDYIKEYCAVHTYYRWGPNTYFTMDENSFCCITNQPQDIAAKIANKMYGEYYYILLINLFHKIVLLKLSIEYSHVQLKLNQDIIDELIHSITTFSAKYYFIEAVSQSQGKELYGLVRKLHGIEELFEEVKLTLNDLFKYQSNYSNRRSSFLLMILTIYTVISGIFGMNQVIEDLKGAIAWHKMLQYSPFEYLALVVTFSGITIVLWLAASTLWQIYKRRMKDKTRKKYLM